MRYFNLEELVCPHVYYRYRESLIWTFFDPRLLETLDWIRDYFDTPVYANNWMFKFEDSLYIKNIKEGGKGIVKEPLGLLSQRGLRCNMCNLVKKQEVTYVSAHITGKGVDFDVKGLSAEEVRKALLNDAHLLPYPIRFEDGVSWVHLDLYNTGTAKIELF